MTPEELADLGYLRRARDLMDREYARRAPGRSIVLLRLSYLALSSACRGSGRAPALSRSVVRCPGSGVCGVAC